MCARTASLTGASVPERASRRASTRLRPRSSGESWPIIQARAKPTDQRPMQPNDGADGWFRRWSRSLIMAAMREGSDSGRVDPDPQADLVDDRAIDDAASDR